jgi:hypothetical protein
VKSLVTLSRDTVAVRMYGEWNVNSRRVTRSLAHPSIGRASHEDE